MQTEEERRMDNECEYLQLKIKLIKILCRTGWSDETKEMIVQVINGVPKCWKSIHQMLIQSVEYELDRINEVEEEDMGLEKVNVVQVFEVPRP